MGKRWDNHCVECERRIDDDYERCFDCNETHNDVMVEVDYVDLVVDKEKSFKLEIEDVDDEQSWFPKSQVHLDQENNIVHLPRWLAEKKELDYRE